MRAAEHASEASRAEQANESNVSGRANGLIAYASISYRFNQKFITFSAFILFARYPNTFGVPQ